MPSEKDKFRFNLLNTEHANNSNKCWLYPMIAKIKIIQSVYYLLCTCSYIILYLVVSFKVLFYDFSFNKMLDINILRYHHIRRCLNETKSNRV